MALCKRSLNYCCNMVTDGCFCLFLLIPVRVSPRQMRWEGNPSKERPVFLCVVGFRIVVQKRITCQPKYM